jgi:hypothetical protein
MVCVLMVTGAGQLLMEGLNMGETKYAEARRLMAQGKDKLAAARDSFREAAKADSDKLPALVGVVQCDVLLSDDEAFGKDFKLLLAIQTKEAKGEAHYWLAQKERRHKNYAAARTAFDVAIGYGHPQAVAEESAMRKEMAQ